MGGWTFCCGEISTCGAGWWQNTTGVELEVKDNIYTPTPNSPSSSFCTGYQNKTSVPEILTLHKMTKFDFPPHFWKALMHNFPM